MISRERSGFIGRFGGLSLRWLIRPNDEHDIQDAMDRSYDSRQGKDQPSSVCVSTCGRANARKELTAGREAKRRSNVDPRAMLQWPLALAKCRVEVA